MYWFEMLQHLPMGPGFLSFSPFLSIYPKMYTMQYRDMAETCHRRNVDGHLLLSAYIFLCLLVICFGLLNITIAGILKSIQFQFMYT